MGKVDRTQLQRGFTLIEMVVVAGMLGFLSVSIVGTFMGTIRGNQTARNQAEVKTQGDFVIASLERQIRNSRTFPTCSAYPGPSDLVTFPILSDNLIRAFRFLPGTPNMIQKNDNYPTGTWVTMSGASVGITGSFTCKADPDGFTSGIVSVDMSVTSLGTSEPVTQPFQTTIAIRSVQ